jgi:hypothetical protein
LAVVSGTYNGSVVQDVNKTTDNGLESWFDFKWSFSLWLLFLFSPLNSQKKKNLTWPCFP